MQIKKVDRIKRVAIVKKIALLHEQDYELASIFHDIQNDNRDEIEKSKNRLLEIHAELEVIDFIISDHESTGKFSKS